MAELIEKERLGKRMTLHLNGGDKFSEIHYVVTLDGKETKMTWHTKTNGSPHYEVVADELHFGDDTFNRFTDENFYERKTMAHHGPNPNAVENLRRVTEEIKELEHALGDTGKYPQGALNPDDEGELRYGIARDGQKVLINFGKPVAWIGFDADQAVELATELVKKAGEIKGVPVTLRIGRADMVCRQETVDDFGSTGDTITASRALKILKGKDND